MRSISRSCFSIAFLIQLMLAPPFLFADSTTVTNTGNVTVRVEYKTGNSDYQNQTLKPGESRELPGGVEKVKVSREQPGQWASPLKPGQDVQVTVKEGTKPVGTLKGYGDKLIFDHPTITPPTTTAIQTNPQPVQNQKPEEPVKPEPTKEQEVPKPQPSKNEPVKPVEGKVTNDGYHTVVVQVVRTDGRTDKNVVLRSGNSLVLPEDASTVRLSQPMIDSGIRFPNQEPIDVKIQQPDGTTTAINDVPAAYTRQTKDIKVTRPYDNLKINYFPNMQFKLNPYQDTMKTNYQSGSSNQTNERDMNSETGQGSQLRSQLNYKF